MNNVPDGQENCKDAGPKSSKTKTGKGNFFVIEKPVILNVISEYGPDAGAALLTLAQHTGPDNRTTTAGVKAICQHTGISRPRAKKILKEHLAGIVTVIGGTKKVPRYFIKPYADIDRIGNHANPLTNAEMTERQREVYDLVQAGKTPRGNDIEKARALCVKGWLNHYNGHYSIARDIDGPPDEDLIWLPNEFVLGTTAKETPPLRLLRETQQSKPLLLYLILAYNHDLEAHGGVDRNVIHRPSFKQKIQEYGEYDVFGFWLPETSTIRRGLPDMQYFPENEFWNNLDILVGLGLASWVWHLVESYETDSALMMPLGGGGESFEIECGRDMEYMVSLMCARDGELPEEGGDFDLYSQEDYIGFDRYAKAYEDEFCNGGCFNGFSYVAIPRHFREAVMVGTVRLRYRPKTALTQSWFGRMNEKAKEVRTTLARVQIQATETKKKVIQFKG